MFRHCEGKDSRETIRCRLHIKPSMFCNKLSYFHFNVRSLAKNKHKIDNFFSMCNVSPDLVAISETKLKSKCCTKIQILNYNFVHVDSLTLSVSRKPQILQSFAIL